MLERVHAKHQVVPSPGPGAGGTRFCGMGEASWLKVADSGWIKSITYGDSMAVAPRFHQLQKSFDSSGHEQLRLAKDVNRSFI